MNKTKSNIRESATDSANKTRNQNEININRAKMMNLKAGKKTCLVFHDAFLVFHFLYASLEGFIILSVATLSTRIKRGPDWPQFSSCNTHCTTVKMASAKLILTFLSVLISVAWAAPPTPPPSLIVPLPPRNILPLPTPAPIELNEFPIENDEVYF